MAVATSARKQLNDLTECPICTEVYKDPRTLPCLHSFCRTCCEGFTRNKLPGSLVGCPLCREKFAIPLIGIHGLRKNFVLEKLKQINQPLTSDYVDSGKSYAKTPLMRFCDEHISKSIDLYCLDCKEAICTSCLTKNHSSHKVSEIEEVFDELRVTLALDVTKLQTAYKMCELHLNEIENEEGNFIKHVKTIETEIANDAKRIQQMIEYHKSELLAEVSAKTRERIKEIDLVKQEVRQQMSFIMSLMSYTTELVRSGAAGDIVREANSLDRRTRSLLDGDQNKKYENLGCYTLAYTSSEAQLTTVIGNLVGTISPINGELLTYSVSCDFSVRVCSLQN